MFAQLPKMTVNVPCLIIQWYINKIYYYFIINYEWIFILKLNYMMICLAFLFAILSKTCKSTLNAGSLLGIWQKCVQIPGK